MSQDPAASTPSPAPAAAKAPTTGKVRGLKRPGPPPRTSTPTKNLPTDRITFPRQLDLLRAYVAASGPSGKPVTNAEAGAIVDMTASTVSMANAFFAETGLLARNGEGGYIPSADVISFQRAYEWNPESAAQKLGPLLSGSWFAKALLPRLTFGELTETEAIAVLAEKAAAGPAHRNRLRMCLEYLIAAGLAQRDGTLLRRGNGQPGPATPERSVSPEPTQTREAPAASRASVATAFTAPTEGVVKFHVSVSVDMDELEGWKPERIAAFFAGIAQVLAAKGQIERDASGS